MRRSGVRFISPAPNNKANPSGLAFFCAKRQTARACGRFCLRLGVAVAAFLPQRQARLFHSLYQLRLGGLIHRRAVSSSLVQLTRVISHSVSLAPFNSWVFRDLSEAFCITELQSCALPQIFPSRKILFHMRKRKR
jgi:hypothetical protein